MKLHLPNRLRPFLIYFFILNSITMLFAKTIKKNTNIYTNFELSINTTTKSTKIFYIAGKTTAFDNGYDSSLFEGTSLSLAIYTQLVSDKNGEKLAIQTLPDEYQKMVIPVGLIASANQEITFSVVVENFPQNLEVYLEDRINNIFINLSQQQYTHTITTNTNGVGQFFLHTSFTGLPTPPSTATWTGNTNNDWHIFSNWFSNTVPNAITDIIIPTSLTNYPTTNSAVTFNSLTIHSGASFIPKNTVTGSVTYRRNIPTNNWHLISTPVTGENTKNLIENHSFVTGSGNNIGIGTFINNGNIPWNYATSITNNEIISGSGIAIKLANPEELSITGTANTNPINYPITTGSRNNFNLIGNPFTAYVNSATFALENTNVLNSQTVWLWNGTNYETYNAANPIEISPGQGFFIEAKSTANVTFNTSNQSHQTTNTFKRAIPKTSFELFIENENTKKSTKVFYIDNKNTGFDNGYDSKIFGGVKSSSFEIFTELVTENRGDKLAIQTLPNTDIETMIIPIGIISEAGKELIFSVNTESFSSDIKIYLEDRIKNTFTNLSEKNHKIILANELKGTGQFYIHTNSKNLKNIPNQHNSQNISIYKSENKSITVKGLKANITSLNIFSILGEKMMSTVLKSTETHIIKLPKMAKGVYIIVLNSDLDTINQKIILE